MMKNIWVFRLFVIPILLSMTACAGGQPAVQPVVMTPVTEATRQLGITTTAPATATLPITGPAEVTPAGVITVAGPLTTTAPLTGAAATTPAGTITAANSLTATAPLTPITTAPSAGSLATPIRTPVAVTPTGAITATTPLTATDGVTVGGALSDTAGMTVVEIIQEVEDFATFAAILQEAGMVETLQGAGPFTIFIPPEEAFAALPQAISEALVADNALLMDVLRYHIIADQADSARLAQLGAAQTVSGAPLAITVSAEGNLLVNEAQIVRSDIPAANGVLHVIDRILSPPSMGLAIPGAPIESIQLADDMTLDETLEELAAADTSGQNVIEIVRSISGLSVAARAIDAAGLAEALAQPGPYTLFIPTDPAFAQMSPEALESLLNNAPALAEMMRAHFVLDQVTSADLARLPVVLTAAGVELPVTVQDNGRIFVNGVPVYQADIEAANGVIHIMGGLLTTPAQ